VVRTGESSWVPQQVVPLQPLRSDWTAIAERLKRLNEVRVRLAHHAVERGKGIEVLTSGGDEMEILPSLKPNRLDLRKKTLKQTRFQIDELGDFIKDLAAVSDATSELTDRTEPIFNAEALAERIRKVKQSALDLVAKQQQKQPPSGNG